MKLNICKSLRTALLACICAATTTAWGEFTRTDALLSDGGTAGTYTSYSQETSAALQLNSLTTAGNTVTLQTDGGTTSLTIGGSNYENGIFNAAWNGGSYLAGHLILSGGVDITLGKSGIVFNGGTLELNSGSSVATDALWVATGSTGTVKVNSGATLTLGTYDNYGTNGTNYNRTGTLTIELKGQLNAKSSLNTSVIKLDGGTLTTSGENHTTGATFKGTGNVQLMDGARGSVNMAENANITVTGSGAVYTDFTGSGNVTISRNYYGEMSHTGDVTFAKASAGYNVGFSSWGDPVYIHNDGDVTVASGATVWTNTNGSNATTMIANSGNLTVNGTLGLNNTTVSIGGAISVEGTGAWLDVGNGVTLAADSLTLGSNTKLTLDDTLNFAGALTLGSGVTIDVTNWTGFTSTDALFTNVTSLTATSPVSIKNGDVTTQYTLTLKDGTVSAPEPATATLSLLALAGLAARRRRK